MIGISTPTFDPDGAMLVAPTTDAEMGEVTRRVNRVKTLDGGAVINDGGSTVADMTLKLVWKPKGRDLEKAQRLARLYQRLVVTTPDGAYSAVPSRVYYAKARDVIEFELLIMSEA